MVLICVLEAILGPLPRFRFRFHQNLGILQVAIPPTYLEAADLAIRFQNPANKAEYPA